MAKQVNKIARNPRTNADAIKASRAIDSVTTEMIENHAITDEKLDVNLANKIRRAYQIPLTKPNVLDLCGQDESGAQVNVELGNGLVYDSATKKITLDIEDLSSKCEFLQDSTGIYLGQKSFINCLKVLNGLYISFNFVPGTDYNVNDSHHLFRINIDSTISDLFNFYLYYQYNYETLTLHAYVARRDDGIYCILGTNSYHEGIVPKNKSFITGHFFLLLK